MSSRRQLLYSGLALLFCFILFELTPLDIWLQQWFYDGRQQAWLWSKEEPVARLLLYNGPKALLILFALTLMTGLAFCRRWRRLSAHCRGIRIVVLSLMLVPMSVSALKATTNVACPRSLQAFDGELPYVKVLESYPPGSRPDSRQRCFPAGHASGGFALMSLMFLFRTPQRRRYALLFGLSAGWITGFYKMVIGDHFFSHTLFSMFLAWFIINLIVLAEGRIFRKRPPAVAEE
ncbi:MAG: phosphatase PAP2 family protein [Candidatus Thiodiazotropha sp.]